MHIGITNHSPNLFQTSLHANIDFDFIRFQCEIFATVAAVAANAGAEKHLSQGKGVELS